MVQKNILLVEDNKLYAEKIGEILSDNGYRVDWASNPIDGVELFGKGSYSLVISDLRMDLMDGNRFLAFVKSLKPETRTILLTGDPDAESELQSLNIAVDQYIDKGIRIDVLLKYIEKIFEKEFANIEKMDIYESAAEQLIIDMRSRTVTIRGTIVALTTREFGILVMLLKDKGKAISREEFIEKLWDKNYEDVDPRVVDVHIKLIRKKLKISTLISVRGFGYKWDE